MTIAIGASASGFSSTSVSSQSTTPVTTSVSGSTFLVGAYYASAGGITSIADTFGNTYAAITAEVANPSDGGFFRIYQNSNANPTGGASHVFGASLSPTQIIMMLAVEVTGGAPIASILDQQNAVYDNAGSPFACTLPATTNPIDMLLAWIFSASASATESFSSTLLTNLVLQYNFSASGVGAAGALSVRVTSTGTYNAAISDSAGYSKALVAMVALKEASSSTNTARIAWVK